MIPSLQIALLCLVAYLVGGIPFGWLVARMKGVDIRKVGSGNVGATNVGRTLGKPWGILVFLLDVTKGATISVLSHYYLLHAEAWQGTGTTQVDWIWLGVGACCIIGNVAPIYLGFRGGKGVATSLGVILGIYPYLTWPGLAAFLMWAIVVKLSRYISLGSIVAACFMPPAFVGIAYLANWCLIEHYPLLVLCASMALLVLLRHRSNIRRLLDGTENRIGQPKA